MGVRMVDRNIAHPRCITVLEDSESNVVIVTAMAGRAVHSGDGPVGGDRA